VFPPSGVFPPAFFRVQGMEWLITPWFEVGSSARCRYCWWAASLERLVGKDFMEARLSKPWFEVPSNTLFRYAWYEATCDYGAVKDAVGACKFAKAPNWNSFAADVVASEAPCKFVYPEKPKILSRPGGSWLRAWGPVMGSTTWYIGAPKRKWGAESGWTPNFWSEIFVEKLNILSLSGFTWPEV